jgi:small subunit ribosomal protein S20
MPVIKSAKKKLKVDRKRESANKKAKAFIDLVTKKAQKKPTPENVREAFKVIDKGVKKDIFHKNKAARIKSRLSKLINKKLHSSTEIKALKPIKIKSNAGKIKKAKIRRLADQK